MSHLKETDEDLPYPYGDYEYYSKTVKGMSYSIHCRHLKSSKVEEVILDVNELAKGHEYSDVSTFKPSPNHKLLAYAVDYSGYETYCCYIKDLATNQLLNDENEVINGLTNSFTRTLKISEQKKFIMSFDAHYITENYKFLSSTQIYNKIIKSILKL